MNHRRRTVMDLLRPGSNKRDDAYLSEDLIRDVQARLGRVEGHVRGISRMLEERRNCDDILTQVAGVKAAIDQIAIQLLEGHLESCVAAAIQSGDCATHVAEFKRSIARVVK